MSRMPIDPLIVDGLEVSRGPNANVFGLGNASGTVNSVPVSANLSRDRTRVETRVDSYEGYRGSLDFNRVLVKNKLAIRASGLFQHEGFVRKPSGVNTVRYNGMIKFQPFRSTTISAAYLHYKMNGNRPNFTPPRDYITDWVNAGKPTWDPVAQVVHLNGQTIDRNGVVTGATIAPITSDANIPANIPITRAGTMSTRGNLYVDQNGVAYWSAPTTNSLTAAVPTPAANSQTIRLMQTGIVGANLGRYTNQPLWTTTPTVGDHSWYDWSSVNLSSVNRLMDSDDVYNVQVDHVFFSTPTQSLAVQLGFFREDTERYQRTPIGNSGTSGQSGQLFIDVNEKNLDGTPNPFLLHPFIGATEPLTRWNPAKWDTYRAQLAYKYDFTRQKNLLKWLGVHQFSAYDEYKYRVSRQYAYREALASDFPWTVSTQNGFFTTQGRAVQSNTTGGPQAGANVARQYIRYYVGDASGSNIDYAPGDFSYGSYPFNWGGYTISSGAAVAGSGRFFSDPARLDLLATSDSTGGNNNIKTIIKTPGAVLQSHFLHDSVVTTFGLRQDKVYSKFGTVPQLVDNMTRHNFANDEHWAAGDYRASSGRTKTLGIVARPFRELGFVKGLSNSGSCAGQFLGDVAKGLSLTFNKSDNFIPQAPAVDLYLRPLPNVTGTDKEYGFWLDLFDSKLVLRFNHYLTKQLNARDSDANTVAQRVLRLDLDISADNYQLYDRADNWWRVAHPEWNDTQVRQGIADQMQIPVDRYDALVTNFRAGTIAATNDVIATGNELELNFNPTNYWTVTGSVTQQKSINANVSQAVQQWIDERMPVWTSIVDQNYNTSLPTGANQGWLADASNPNHLWWLHSYGGSQTPQQNFASFVNAPYSVIKQLDGKSRPSVREYNFKLSSSLTLSAFTQNRVLRNVKLGGAVRWEDKGAIGYYGMQQLPAIITELNASNPIWDKSHYYVDAYVSYRMKLFRDRIGASFQLNVRNLGENGRLQPIGAFPNGTPNAYRIVDPQQFILTASFDL
jgi:hypothetical protein